MDLLVSHQLHKALFFSLSVIHVKYGLALEKTWIRDATFDNKLSSIGLSLVSRSRIHCGKTCLHNNTCVSFFFAPKQYCNCQLLDHKLSSVAGLADVIEVTYYILYDPSTTTSAPTLSTTTPTTTTPTMTTVPTTTSTTTTPMTTVPTTTSTTTTPAMTTTPTTTSTTTTPAMTTTPTTTSTTTTPAMTTVPTTTTTSSPPFSCPSDHAGFITVLLADGDSFTYKVAKVLKSQEEAIKTCNDHGGFLARVTTVAKMDMLLELIRTCPGYSGVYDYYVDGSNADASNYTAPGAWIMSNGELVPMSNDFWGAMKPNFPTEQHCLRMTADINYMWDDCSCSLEHYFICESY